MTIKEVEQRTGLPRSVIRFYEKEGLIAPGRNAENRYRDYTQKDAERLTRIAFLRTLDIPIEAIQRVMAGEAALGDVAGAQGDVLRAKEKALARAAQICARLAQDAPEGLDALDVARYTGEPETYVQENRNTLLRDCEHFALWFGSDGCWVILLALAALFAAMVFPRLPGRIPVQWDSDGVTTNTAPCAAIFAYPLMLAAVRLLLGGRMKSVSRHYFGFYGDTVAAYIINGLSLLVLCMEIFSVLYIYGAVRSVDALILLCGAFVLALLALAGRRFVVKN